MTGKSPRAASFLGKPEVFKTGTALARQQTPLWMTGKSPRAVSFLGKASDIVEIVGFKVSIMKIVGLKVSNMT